MVVVLVYTVVFTVAQYSVFCIRIHWIRIRRFSDSGSLILDPDSGSFPNAPPDPGCAYPDPKSLFTNVSKLEQKSKGTDIAIHLHEGVQADPGESGFNSDAKHCQLPIGTFRTYWWIVFASQACFPTAHGPRRPGNARQRESAARGRRGHPQPPRPQAGRVGKNPGLKKNSPVGLFVFFLYICPEERV